MREANFFFGIILGYFLGMVFLNKESWKYFMSSIAIGFEQFGTRCSNKVQEPACKN